MTKDFEPFQKVLVRLQEGEVWKCAFYDRKGVGKYHIVIGPAYDPTDGNILPYNDETKHLLGTKNDPTPKWEPKPDELVAENRELRERVREFQLGEVEFDNSGLCRENDALKRQRDWLAQKCEAFCLDSDLEDCPHCPFREETPCFLSDKESWIKFAEQAAKEANDA